MLGLELYPDPYNKDETVLSPTASNDMWQYSWQRILSPAVDTELGGKPFASCIATAIPG